MPMSATAKLTQINVVVSNLDESVKFYGRLGLRFVVDSVHTTHAQCVLADGTTVALDTEAAVAQFTEGWTPPTGGPRVAFAFGLPSADAVDALHAELIAAGYRSMREPWSADWGIRYATVLDPDGIPADLQAAL
jgi:catechol 2,3-dioxygenase-like lactoylglutathione lyase family enzyme